MVRNGELKAPVVIGRDHLDSGSVASPNRETESMKDGSDAVSDWALLNALAEHRGRRDLGVAAPRWWCRHGLSQHAGLVIVCDGTAEADKRIDRVLWNDPASGVMRHADAGYDIAIDCANEFGLKLPMIGGNKAKRRLEMNLTINKQLVTLDVLRRVWMEPVTVSLGNEAKRCIAEANELVDDVVASGKQVYGVNTGFGQLASVRISNDELAHLQANLVRSHAVGVGEDLQDDIVRLVMLMKVVALAEGFSGVRVELVEMLCEMINHNIYPRIPSRGSVVRLGRPRATCTYVGRVARRRRGTRQRSGDAGDSSPEGSRDSSRYSWRPRKDSRC